MENQFIPPPNLAPQPTPATPPIIQHNSNAKYFIFLFVLLIIAGLVWYFYPQPSKVQPSNTAVNNDSINPISSFWQQFSSGNYLVKVEGGGSLGQLFYFEKGELIRVGDPINEAGKAYFIIKDGKLYSIKSFEKTYKEFDINSEQGKVIFDGLKYMSLIDPFIKDARNNNFTWNIDGNGYIAKQKWNVYDGNGNSFPVDVRIVQNPSTNQIISIFVRESSEKNWQETNFSYETINNIEVVKNLPPDYKKTN